MLAVIAVNDVFKREIPNVLLLLLMVVISVNTPFSVSSLLVFLSILAWCRGFQVTGHMCLCFVRAVVLDVDYNRFVGGSPKCHLCGFQSNG